MICLLGAGAGAGVGAGIGAGARDAKDGRLFKVDEDGKVDKAGRGGPMMLAMRAGLV